MKVKNEPVSAFAIYSEKLKQKKKRPVSKLIRGNGKINKAKFKNNNGKIKEIGLSKFSKILVEQSKNSKPKILQSTADKESSLKLGITSDTSTNAAGKIENKLPINTKKGKKKLVNRLKSEISINNIEFTKNAKASSGNTPPLDNGFSHKNEKLSQVTKQSLSKGTVLETERCKTSPLKKKKKSLLINLGDSDATAIQQKENSNIVETTEEKEDKCNINISIKKQNILKSSKKSTPNKKLSKVNLKNKNENKVLSSHWADQENSTLAAKKLFEWLILPIKQQDLMRDYWEKKPLLIQREGNRNYYSELLSSQVIDTMLREKLVFFTKHLDVTSYTDGVRETHNLSGRAQANVVWDFYSNGCSIRLLNPQIYIPKIHTLNATLQEYFGCFIGANVYLTPPNSQGFAPHYDDIEAFVLQIEGKKHWKVYPPRCDKETLPRFSSPNFSQEEIGKPVLDVVLEPGDMLYFPRGFIHQAATVDGNHSLHITLSAYQKTAWVDLFEKALPVALKRAAEESVEFRKGLPRNYLGIEYHGSDAVKTSFMNTAQRLFSELGRFFELSLGAGVDLMGAQFMHDALPPVFTPGEKQNSAIYGGLKLNNGSLSDRVDIELDSHIRLIRENVCRLVEEEEEVRLYHCLDNPLEYHAEDPQFLVLPPEGVAVITVLASKFPAFVEVRSLPHTDEEALLALLSDLWDAGLLVNRGVQHVKT